MGNYNFIPMKPEYSSKQHLLFIGVLAVIFFFLMAPFLVDSIGLEEKLQKADLTYSNLFIKFKEVKKSKAVFQIDEELENRDLKSTLPPITEESTGDILRKLSDEIKQQDMFKEHGAEIK